MTPRFQRRMPRSRLVAGLAVLLALAAHAAALVRNDAVEEAQYEGGGGDGAIAALGSAFEDMTAGRAEPVTADETTPEAPVEQAPPEDREVSQPEKTAETPKAEPVETPVEPVEETTETAPEAAKPVVKPVVTPMETTAARQQPAKPVAQTPVPRQAQAPYCCRSIST